MAKDQLQPASVEERIFKTTQKIQGNLMTLAYPQQLFVSLLLHKHLLQFLV